MSLVLRCSSSLTLCTSILMAVDKDEMAIGALLFSVPTNPVVNHVTNFTMAVLVSIF